MRAEDDFTSTLTELYRLFEGEEDIQVTLKRVVDLASRTIEGCDGAGVTLMLGSRKSTSAATNDLVLEVDQLQYEFDEGPCLSSISTGDMNRIDAMADEKRWARFAGRAAERGVQSALSFPLEIQGDRIGSLNLYALRPGAFDDSDQHTGAMFAEQASVALHNTQLYAKTLSLTRQLEEALASRTTIAQAIGILMERTSSTADQAFDALRAASQKQNRKLRDIAEEIVNGPSETS